MSEATAPLPALALPQEPDDRIDRAIALLAECVQVNHEAVVFMTDLMAGRETPVEAMMLVNRVADIGYDLRGLADLPAALRDAALIEAAGLTAPPLAEAEPEPVPGRLRARARQKGRHAVQAPIMRVVPSGALLPAAAAFKLRWPSLHALAGHKVLLTAGAGSALAASAVVGMHANHALPFVTGTGPGSWHAPAAIAWGAAPVPSSPPPVVTITPPRPAGKHHGPAVTLTVTLPPQAPSFSVPDPPAPPTSPDSSDSSDPSLSPDLSLSSAPPDDGSGDVSKQERKAERKAERKLERQLGDAADSVTGDLTGDGGTGRHRRHDRGDNGQLSGDLSGLTGTSP